LITILTYHGVTDLPRAGIENYQAKHIAAEEFARQMQWLHERERVLSLAELVEHHRHGRDVDGVVVTFDDGYRNNLTVALPILERYKVHATFFITTGFIDGDRLFWVDEVELLIDQTDAESIDLSDFGLPSYRLGTAEERMRAVTGVKKALKRIDDEACREVVARLRQDIPVPAGRPRSRNYLPMTWEEVRTLARHPLVDIGAHSVDHPILTRIGSTRLDREVRESKTALERELGRPVTFFAYPNGGPEDFDADVVAAVKAHGFTCACTTLPGRNTVSTDLFELRRYFVGLDGAPFPCWAGSGAAPA
jgi:peptidoglycan/xylan/chitin deacetylase (PgdA/CDA1 family)